GTVGGELGIGKYKEHARNRLRASVMSIGLKGHTALGGHTLGYGVTFNSEKIMDRTREWEMRDSAGYSLPSDGTAVKVIYNLASQHDLSTNRMAFYVQDTYKAQIDAGILSVNGGIRCSYWDYNREFLVSPRVSVGFIPSGRQDLALRFSTGLYYQAPFYKEYRLPVEDADGNVVVKLNNGIKSQQSLHFILGSDYTFRAMERPFKVSAEAYYKKLDRLVPYEIDNLKITYSGLNQSNGYAMGLDFKLFGQFVPGSDSWLSFSLMKTQENLHGVKVPRPSDQRYSVALFFTDFFPGIPRLKFNLRGILNDGLPVTPPQSTRDKGYFRTPPYKRIDVGLSYALVKPRVSGEPRGNGLGRWFKSAWVGLDVFNLLNISNVSSYYWVTDVNDIQYAVPNYLTRRQVNVRLTLDF
ncbi:MAG: TonB-dependent receptor, partial [Muribaculaceae bacterium]|nr:TonB-dependent receptor [Muribaculaceae bacterium]